MMRILELSNLSSEAVKREIMDIQEKNAPEKPNNQGGWRFWLFVTIMVTILAMVKIIS